MSSPGQDSPYSPLSRALAEARALAAEGSKIPPPLPRPDIHPPPIPTKVVPTLAASQAALKESIRQERAAALLDQAELERFKNLIVFAKTTVESRFSGRHKSPDLGTGGEFTEFQAYFPGLPIQAIDWRVYARTKKLVIRRFREETDMDVHLLVDASGSMAYRGGNREVKGTRAARVAAALAYLMIRQGDKASMTLFADRVIDHVPPAGTRRHVQSLLRTLVRPAHEATGRTNLPAAIEECSQLFRRRGRLVILSDFLGHSPAEVFDALGPLLHRGFEILLMQLQDPDEITLPDAPLARFVDMETGDAIEVEPAEIRSAYEARIRERTTEFASGSARHRIEFTTLDTDRPYREAIEAYLGFRQLST